MASKELALSRDKKVLGVAGGIAEYIDAPSAWVRIIAIIFIIATGVIPGLIIYWLLSKVLGAPKSEKDQQI